MNTIFLVGSVALAVGLLGVLAVAATGLRTRPRLIHSNLSRGLPEGWAPGRLLAGTPMAAYFDRLLAGAGRPVGWPLLRVLSAKVLVTAGAALLALWLMAQLRTPQVFIGSILLVVFAFFLPDLLLYNAAIRRRHAITLALPDTLDQLSIAVEAGLGFDAALVRVARNGTGPLAQELIRTMQDIQVGQPRREAYLALGNRVRVPALRRFMRSVVQAEEYGIALADVLNVQARELRIDRRQRAETQAMKIPVKVVFPLALCILPVLFIVLLGPAAINIMQAFAGR